MRPRFHRGGIKGLSPFFAFQDIITSAMAVLIAIIMLLAVSLSGPGTAGLAAPENRALALRLRALLDEIARLKSELQTRLDLSTDAAADPRLLVGQVQALREELAVVTSQRQSASQQAVSIQKSEGARLIRDELEQKDKRVREAQARLRTMQEDARAVRAEMERASQEVQNQEARLLAERARRNQLWLMPERSTSGKQPLMVTVSGTEVALQRFDHPEKQSLTGPDRARAFELALRKYSKLDDYVVFYFKPSGASQFIALTAIARDAGFEIGYDALVEETTINFGPAPQ